MTEFLKAKNIGKIKSMAKEKIPLLFLSFQTLYI